MSNGYMDKKVATSQNASSGEGTPEVTEGAEVPVEQPKSKPMGKTQKSKGKGKRKVKNLAMLKKAAKNVMSGKDAFDDNEAPEPDEDDMA